MSIAPLYPIAALGAMGAAAGSMKMAAGAAGGFADVLGAAVERVAEPSPSGEPPPTQQQLAEQMAAARGPAGRESLYRELTGRSPDYPGEPINLEDVRLHSQSRLSQLGREIHQQLAVAGIDVNEPIRVQVAGDGRLVVGDHPQREAIEKLLNEDSALANDLRQLHATFDLLRAADAHHEFATAYAKDPVNAVSQFAQLFDAKPGPHQSTLVLDGQQVYVE